MRTTEQILNEIQSSITLNKEVRAKCNTALTDAISLILHNEKEMKDRLDEEYKRGTNEAWEIAREIYADYEEFTDIFGKEASIGDVIRTIDPLRAKEKILSYREEKSKVCIGDVVENNKDGTKAIILDKGDYWIAYTENGYVKSWCKNDFNKTGEHIDVNSILIKLLR